MSARRPLEHLQPWLGLAAAALGWGVAHQVGSASIFTPWAVVIGILPVGAACAAWFWPKEGSVSPEPVID